MSFKQISIVSFFSKPSLKPRTPLPLEILTTEDGKTARLSSQIKESEEFPLSREQEEIFSQIKESEEFPSSRAQEEISSQRETGGSSCQDTDKQDPFDGTEVGLDVVKPVNNEDYVCIHKNLTHSEMKGNEIVENEFEKNTSVLKLKSENPCDVEREGNSFFKLKNENQCYLQREHISSCKIKRGKKGLIPASEEEEHKPFHSNTDANANTNPNSTANTTAIATTTEYEKVREENVRRNRILLEKLGISSLGLLTNDVKDCSNLKSKSLTKRKATMTAIVCPSSLPIRRSRRLLHEDSAELNANIGIDGTPTKRQCKVSQIDEYAGEDATLFYDDSSVLKYTCSKAVDATKLDSKIESTLSKLESRNILGFKSSGRFLQDMHLTRIYTMDICFPLHGGHRALLSAGGHQGQIAIFGTNMITQDSNCSETDDSGSLMSWKGGNGWISGVKFITSHARENSMLVLSSANDGKLVLWDVNKQQKLAHSSNRSTPPLKVTEARNIHLNGIFSMDEVAGHIATASKDSTIGYSNIANQGILLERSIGGHHSGPIRCVNFRNENIIADCGADGLICVLDIRLSEPLVLSIDTNNATGVNVVEWCPSQEYLLLSASKDPYISLYDIRNPKEFLHKLHGHIDPKLQKCSHIYRPTFVDHGRVVASPGQGSNAISLYSVETSKAISRGHLGYDANMVMWSSCEQNNSTFLWVASKSISQLIPLW